MYKSYHWQKRYYFITFYTYPSRTYQILKILIYAHSYLKVDNDVQVASLSQSKCLFASRQAFVRFSPQHPALCTESMTRQDLKFSTLIDYMEVNGNMNVLEHSDESTDLKNSLGQIAFSKHQNKRRMLSPSVQFSSAVFSWGPCYSRSPSG